MKICPNKHTMPNGENFPDMFVACPICGTALVDEMQNAQPVCRKCGMQLDKTWNICPACGTAVKEEPSVSTNNNSAIPADVLELLERRHEIRKLNLHNCGDTKKKAELRKIDAELNEKNQLIKYIDMDKKSPNAELEDYIGDQCEKEEEQFEWWIKSADNGCVEDYHSAYMAFWDGIGGEEDFDKAWEYLEKGVSCGDYMCIKEMADNLFDAWSPEDDPKVILALTEKLINCDNTGFKKRGFYLRGLIADKSEDYESAFTFFKKSFELGSGDAGLKLAEMYICGLVVEPDIEIAISIYKKIIDERMGDDSINAEAAYQLGDIYFLEKEDSESSFLYYKLAADLGYETAYMPVALSYKDGAGVEPDSKKSLYWVKKACDSEEDFISAWAYRTLGDWYSDGKNCCEEDPYKAFDYYKIAAEKGNSEAQNRVGVFYDNGNYVEQNHQKAVYWYKKALKSDENNLPAKFNLGLSYYYGTGVNVDEDYGLQLIQEAADGGYESAQEWLNENT